MVERELPKLNTRVRFPSPALNPLLDLMRPIDEVQGEPFTHKVTPRFQRFLAVRSCFCATFNVRSKTTKKRFKIPFDRDLSTFRIFRAKCIVHISTRRIIAMHIGLSFGREGAKSVLLY